MNAREKLKFHMWASMSPLLVVAMNVNVYADAADSATIKPVSNKSNGSAGCVDLYADCSTLMINYYGDSVEFALFRNEGVKDETHAADSTDNNPSDELAAPIEARSGSETVKSENISELLGIDFLRGLGDKDIAPAFHTELAAVDDGAAEDNGSAERVAADKVAEAGTKHSWAVAAATSMDNKYQPSNPDGITATSTASEGPPVFWDFAHVYQWEVKENVLDSGKRDISQVSLSDIYLSPKIISSSDPKIVVCELNDQKNCRPLSD